MNSLIVNVANEAELLEEFPCYGLFCPVNARERAEIRRIHGEIVWCTLREVSSRTSHLEWPEGTLITIRAMLDSLLFAGEDSTLRF